MIYKVFYQESKDRNPKREQTRVLYIQVEAKNKLEGRIKVRELVETKTAFNIEFIEHLSEKHLAYEQEHADFKLTEF